MSDVISFIIDGVDVRTKKGKSILEAAEEAGVYIPRLCHMKDLAPFGSCRVCTVLVNGKPQSACTQPAGQGIVVESASEKVRGIRRRIVEMLFVEGNHYCMSCEKSGNCELQAVAYRLGITSTELPYFHPAKEVDASHPDMLIDRNRCILCGRCVRASRDLDGKSVFGFAGRGIHRRIVISSHGRMVDTGLSTADRAAEACPVGAIIRKRVGFAVPVGRRLYDEKPIGSDVETRRPG